MKDQIKNHVEPEETFSDALKSVVQKIEVNASFKTELGKQLMEAHQPARLGFAQSTFNRAVPAFGWMFALALMALVLNWVFRSIAPPPMPAAQETSILSAQETPSHIPTEMTTSVPDGEGYEWRGAKLYLAQPLPESPAEANVYQLKKDQQVTPDEARVLASRFGLQGEMYTSYDYVFSVDDYYFTDGKQALQIYSNRRFTYTADLAKASTTEIQFTPTEDAEANIREFLSARGFEFPFKITPNEYFGGYSLEPLALDGLTIQYESFTFPPMLIKLDENGAVFSIDATLVDYDSTPLGMYGIISAQEALNNLMNDNEQGGKMEFFHSAHNKLPQTWNRVYPESQTVTIYGYVSSNLPGDSSKPPFITIDGVPAIGNVNGLEQLERATLIEATGQFLVQDGLRQFEVTSWTTEVEMAYISGTPRRDGDQIILAVSDGSDQRAPLVGPGKEYPLIDPPVDLPVDIKPESQLTVSGVFVGEEIFWTNIQYLEIVGDGGGGGGGGGLGFYQLNLSGTPIPFPTAQPQVNQTGVEYIVKEGDTIFAIAESYGITPDEIIQANEWLSEEHALLPGKTLIIPGVQSSSAVGQYIVKENDTLAEIALKHGVAVEELVQANGLLDPDHLFLGQVLIIPRLESSTEQRVENMRGFLSISIHKSADGSQLPSYIFSVSDSNTDIYYELEGSNLSELDPYHGLPIIVSGTVRKDDFIPTLSMDSYQIPFPALQFQILKGTQKVQEIDGQIATLFTTETGQTYVEFWTNTGQLKFSIIGVEGDLIQQEVLIVPDETFASYPVIRVFSAGMAISPKDGQPMELPLTANQIPVYDEAANPEVPDTTPPNLTIDQVELVYFVSNPYYQVNDPNYSQRSPYLQPAWHFIGRYDDGTEFDILIQALKQEFLLPELAPGLSPG